MATYSIINVLFVFTPISWATHFAKKDNGDHVVGPRVQFIRQFLSCLGVGQSLKHIPRPQCAF